MSASDLIAMGIPADKAHAAFERCSTVEAAFEWLSSHAGDDSDGGGGGGSGGSGGSGGGSGGGGGGSHPEHDPALPARLELTCPAARVGQLIGPRGSTIRGIEQQSGARVEVNSCVTPCSVVISGNTPAVEMAMSLVAAITHPPTLELTCKSALGGQLIGPRGATIRGIQEQTGARVDVRVA